MDQVDNKSAFGQGPLDHLILMESSQTTQLRQQTHKQIRSRIHLKLDLTADCQSLCKKTPTKIKHQMTSESDWMEPADGRDSDAPYIVQKRVAEGAHADVPSSACLHWEPVIILIMWLSELMLARGEASPAVSINKPSLDGALISHCTGAVLFTAATSLTLLIPKGFFFFFFFLYGVRSGEVGGDTGSDELVLGGTYLCAAA